MGHGITQNDAVLLHKQQAWHGLGMVVSDLLTPREALTRINADWTVDQHPVWVWVNGARVQVPGFMANYRSDLVPGQDENAYLGMVSESYNPVDNDLLAEFCYDLGKAGSKVTVESAGTVFGGKKIWFLLHGENIQIGKGGDTVCTYLLVNNSHDGTGSLRITPTTVRVVCQNTLHMVVPAKDTGLLGKSVMAYRHTSSIHDRLEAAKQALAAWDHATQTTKAVCDKMASIQMDDQARKDYFFRQYELDYGAIDVTKDSSKGKAADAYLAFCKRWDDEKELHGGSLWGTLNAYTGMVQHDQKARGKDDVDRIQRRVESNLFGLASRRTQAAFDAALTMVSA